MEKNGTVSVTTGVNSFFSSSSNLSKLSLLSVQRFFAAGVWIYPSGKGYKYNSKTCKKSVTYKRHSGFWKNKHGSVDRD